MYVGIICKAYYLQVREHAGTRQIFAVLVSHGTCRLDSSES
jgi:hypothetical protein